MSKNKQHGSRLVVLRDGLYNRHLVQTYMLEDMCTETPEQKLHHEILEEMHEAVWRDYCGYWNIVSAIREGYKPIRKD